MKRSRTCLNLFELDTPAAPKRTCSLPSNLGSFISSSCGSSSGSSFSVSVRQNQERLLFLQQHAASTLAQGTAAAPATIADGKFVVESIVRSQASLNEITIHEGQQFIGQESNEAATAVPQQQSFAARVQSSEQQQQQQQPLSLFGGAAIGSLFEDGGESSDYFCGVDSSDEADEDSTVMAASAAAECAISTTCDSSRGAECARQVSDADDNNASCARQVSDSSSSSCSSISNGSRGSGSSGGGSAERYAFEGDDDGIIGTAADPFVDLDTAAAAGLSFSLPAAHRWGGGGGGGGVVVPPQPLVAATGPHAGGSWQPAAAGAPRVSVRISGGGGVGTSRERSMTVPPPWPATMVPTSALMNGWSAGPIAGAGHSGDGGNSWRRQRQRGRRRCRGDAGGDGSGEEEYDGSLVSAAAGLSDDAKMLIGMNRLRLVDLAPENASF